MKLLTIIAFTVWSFFLVPLSLNAQAPSGVMPTPATAPTTDEVIKLNQELAQHDKDIVAEKAAIDAERAQEAQDIKALRDAIAQAPGDTPKLATAEQLDKVAKAVETLQNESVLIQTNQKTRDMNNYANGDDILILLRLEANRISSNMQSGDISADYEYASNPLHYEKFQTLIAELKGDDYYNGNSDPTEQLKSLFGQNPIMGTILTVVSIFSKKKTSSGKSTTLKNALSLLQIIGDSKADHEILESQRADILSRATKLNGEVEGYLPKYASLVNYTTFTSNDFLIPTNVTNACTKRFFPGAGDNSSPIIADDYNANTHSVAQYVAEYRALTESVMAYHTTYANVLSKTKVALKASFFADDPAAAKLDMAIQTNTHLTDDDQKAFAQSLAVSLTFPVSQM